MVHGPGRRSGQDQRASPARLTASIRDPFWRGLYQPVVDWVGWATERSNALQFLTIRRYLTLMFLALAVLLTLVAVSQ